MQFTLIMGHGGFGASWWCFLKTASGSEALMISHLCCGGLRACDSIFQQSVSACLVWELWKLCNAFVFENRVVDGNIILIKAVETS